MNHLFICILYLITIIIYILFNSQYIMIMIQISELHNKNLRDMLQYYYNFLFNRY